MVCFGESLSKFEIGRRGIDVSGRCLQVGGGTPFGEEERGGGAPQAMGGVSVRWNVMDFGMVMG